MGRGIFRIGYTELEYIQSSGTQYIDTGFAPNQDTRVSIDFDMPRDATAQYAAIADGRISYKNCDFSAKIRMNASTYSIVTRYGSQEKTGAAPYPNSAFHLELSKDGCIFSGVTLSFEKETFQSTNTMLLGKAIKETQGTSGLRIFSCQIYDNGTLVRDYVPCKNPTGEVGLYDLVNSQFYGNAGTGAFEAGPEVTPSLEELFGGIANAIREQDGTTEEIVAQDFPERIRGFHTSAITARSSDPAGGTVSGGGLASQGMTVTVKAEPKEGYRFAGWYDNGAPRLPAGYTETEYIQSSRTQYIDTGIRGNQNTKAQIDACLLNTRTDANYALIFGSIATPSNAITMNLSPTTGLSRFGASTVQSGYIVALESRHSFSIERSGTYVDGVLTGSFSPMDDFETNRTLYILNASGNSNLGAFRLYSCQIYDNGTLVRDYVPCKAPDGSVGLYDLVNGAFYANAGTGDFEAGPEVNPPASADAEYTFTVSGARNLVGVFEEEQGNG